MTGKHLLESSPHNNGRGTRGQARLHQHIFKCLHQVWCCSKVNHRPSPKLRSKEINFRKGKEEGVDILKQKSDLPHTYVIHRWEYTLSYCFLNLAKDQEAKHFVFCVLLWHHRQLICLELTNSTNHYPTELIDCLIISNETYFQRCIGCSEFSLHHVMY